MGCLHSSFGICSSFSVSSYMDCFSNAFSETSLYIFLEITELVSSNATCIDSSTTRVFLLKTRYALLVVEYPRKIASSALESNILKLSFPLL